MKKFAPYLKSRVTLIITSIGLLMLFFLLLPIISAYTKFDFPLITKLISAKEISVPEKPDKLTKTPKPTKPPKDNKPNKPTPTLTLIPTETPTPTSTPSPTITPRPIPHGKKLFFVSTNQQGPKMWQGFISPYDPAPEESQILSMEIADSQPVESVSLTMKTDHGQQTIPMMLVEGDLLNGRWEGTRAVNDTYLYNYHAVFEAVSINGKSTVDVTLR